MEKDGIGIGFWLENFGEVEMRFYPDIHLDGVYIGPLNEKIIHAKMEETANRLIEEIKQQQKLK